MNIEIVFLLTLLLVISVIFLILHLILPAFGFKLFARKKDPLEKDLIYLLDSGWEISLSNYKYLRAKAHDETKLREIEEAVERQKELDKIKKLNLPSDDGY